MATRVRARGLAILVLASALLAAGCGAATTDSPGVVQPTAASDPAGPPAAGPAVAATREALFAALRRATLVVADSAVPYRPAEAGALRTTPRSVYQVTLPAEANPGYVVVYAFDTQEAAVAAAKAQVDYLASGPGKVQSPLGTDHVLQQLGSTVIYYEWLPAAALDPSTPRVAEALRTVGTSFPTR